MLAYLSDCNARALPDCAYSTVPAIGEPAIEFAWTLNLITCADPEGGEWIQTHRNWSIVCPEARFDEKDVEVIIIFLFSYLYTSSGMHCIHGVGLCSPSGIGLLIVGNNGDGKTVTSLRLLSEGHSYIGNDRVVLKRQRQEILMIAGSRPIRVRLGTIRDVLPNFSSSVDPHDLDQWGSFRTLDPHSCGFQPAGSSPIRFLFRVRVAPMDNSDCTSTKMSNLDPRYSAARFYQMTGPYALSRHLVHLGIRRPFPALDTDDLAAERLQIAEDLIGSVQSFELFGNDLWIAAQIHKLCDGEV